MAELRISVEGGSGHELASLYRWLLREDELRGMVRPDHSPVAPGEMGVPIEWLSVAVGSGGALTVLAHSIATCVKDVLTKPRSPDLRLRIEGADGLSAEVEVRDLDKLEALLRRVARPPEPEL